MEECQVAEDGQDRAGILELARVQLPQLREGSSHAGIQAPAWLQPAKVAGHQAPPQLGHKSGCCKVRNISIPVDTKCALSDEFVHGVRVPPVAAGSFDVKSCACSTMLHPALGVPHRVKAAMTWSVASSMASEDHVSAVRRSQAILRGRDITCRCLAGSWSYA